MGRRPAGHAATERSGKGLPVVRLVWQPGFAADLEPNWVGGWDFTGHEVNARFKGYSRP